MATIVKHGNVQHTCPHCKCVFTLDDGEELNLCPDCKKEIVISKKSSVAKERELGHVRHYPGYGAERDFGNQWDD
jgi:hypothetical protein